MPLGKNMRPDQSSIEKLLWLFDPESLQIKYFWSDVILTPGSESNTVVLVHAIIVKRNRVSSER